MAICYAMKEEMIRLYAITDYEKAVEGWKRWVKAAKESGIPALVRFVKLKEKRIDGLANTPNALLTQADWKGTTRSRLPNGMQIGTRTISTFLP